MGQYIFRESKRIRIRIRIRITLFYIEFLKLQTLAVSYLSMIVVFVLTYLLYGICEIKSSQGEWKKTQERAQRLLINDKTSSSSSWLKKSSHSTLHMRYIKTIGCEFLRL